MSPGASVWLTDVFLTVELYGRDELGGQTVLYVCLLNKSMGVIRLIYVLLYTEDIWV